MKYKIYRVDEYKKANKKVIDENFIEYNIDELVENLKRDNSYHFRIHKKTQYIFFGDLDHYNKSIDEYIIILQGFMKKYYNLEFTEEEFKYTKNNTKDGSYHFSIPKFNCLTEKNKEIIKNFMKITQIEMDTTIYSEHWFRCPNQSKGSEMGGIHVIINGDILDQIVEHIPENSRNINDVKFIDKDEIKNKKNIIKQQEVSLDDTECENVDDKNHIVKLLNLISSKRVDNYEEWINIGMALYNTNPNYIDLWIKISKNSEKYSEGVCEKHWKTFRNSDNKLTIGSLHHWAKEDNYKRYIEFRKESCIRQFIKDHEEDISSIDADEIQIGRIISNQNLCTANLNENHCIISKKDHKNPSNYIQIINDNGGIIGCKNKHCFGKTYKNCIFSTNNHINNGIFGTERPVIIIAKNFNQQINNSYIENDDNILICDNYKIFDDLEFNKLVMESLNNTPYDIANVLWYLTQDQFKCTKNKVWYYFKNHRWIQNNTEIKYFISTQLPQTYKTVLKFYKDLSKKTTNETDFKNLKIKINKIIELIHSLKKTAPKHNIVEEAEDIFYRNDEGFENKLDSNSNLIGFNNGVYDLESFIFREGKNDDFITLSTGYDYVYKNNIDEELNKFLTDIQPDENERNYMLTVLSVSLVGTNILELLHIMSGTGRNGKSKIAELMGLTFGDYYEPISATLLTREQPSADKPRPELLILKNKRLIIASEPENKNQTLNASFIKLITGNDKLTARALHENKIITFIPNFNLFILCNDIPNFDKNDDAIWSRCRCVEFPIKFVENPIGEKQKQINYELKNKLPNWKMDFMLILIDKYRSYKMSNSNIIIPQNVLRFTKKTKDENDIYKQYITERTIKSCNHIHISTLYRDFIIWYKYNHQNKCFPSNREFIKNLKHHVTVSETVRIGNNISTGVKNLSINNT